MHIPNLFAATIFAAFPIFATGVIAADDMGSAENAVSAEQKEGNTTSASADANGAGPIEFRTILGNRPITIPEDEVTPAFEEFRETGENPFTGDDDAVAEGKKIYDRFCQACHLKGGEGRIGPSLIDDNWRHERTATEVGRFEIIHSGGAGSMQAFDTRLDLDEILKVMAYVDTLRKE